MEPPSYEFQPPPYEPPAYDVSQAVSQQNRTSQLRDTVRMDLSSFEDEFRRRHIENCFHHVANCCSLIGGIILVALNIAGGIIYYNILVNNVLIWYNIVCGINILTNTLLRLMCHRRDREKLAKFSFVVCGVMTIIGVILCSVESEQYPHFVFSASLSTLIIYLFIELLNSCVHIH